MEAWAKGGRSGVQNEEQKNGKEDGRVEGRTFIDKEIRQNRWKDGGTEEGRTERWKERKDRN